jgi:DNA-binding FadR family transcriptional regulator
MDYFTSVRPTRAYEAVAQQIESAILSGRLKPGHKLPPEREVIRLFNVSRRTLQEAWRILEQKGLIEIKRGSKGGAFIIDNVRNQVSDSLNLLIRQKKISLAELTEFRIQTEGQVAELAAKNASTADCQELKELILKGKRIVSQDTPHYDEALKLESGLHLKLAEFCGNNLYAIILKTIHDLLVVPSYEFDPVDKDYVIRAFSDWERIFDALVNGRPADVRQLVMDHVIYFSEYGPEDI